MHVADRPGCLERLSQVRPAVLVAGAAGFQKNAASTPTTKQHCQKEIGSQPSQKHTQGAAITQAATATLQRRRGIYPPAPAGVLPNYAARLQAFLQACLTARNNTHAPKGTTRHSPASTLKARHSRAACLSAGQSFRTDVATLSLVNVSPQGACCCQLPFCPTRPTNPTKKTCHSITAGWRWRRQPWLPCTLG